MKIYSKIDLLKEIKISYQTLLRYEKLGIIARPKQKIGQSRAYSENEYKKIVDKIQDLINNPGKYKALNIKIQRSNAVK